MRAKRISYDSLRWVEHSGLSKTWSVELPGDFRAFIEPRPYTTPFQCTIQDSDGDAWAFEYGRTKRDAFDRAIQALSITVRASLVSIRALQRALPAAPGPKSN